MLLKSGKVSQQVKAGVNIAEIEQVDTRVEELADGRKREVAVYANTYLHGLPFGQPPLSEVLAPVELLPGDTVRVTAAGLTPYDVTRKGAVVWSNPELVKVEAARAGEVAERIEHRKEARR